MVEPSGKPILMYSCPELYDTEDKLVPVDAEDVAVCTEECIFKESNPCSDEAVFELCLDHMAENDMDIPSDAQEATLLYRLLRDAIYRDL